MERGSQTTGVGNVLAQRQTTIDMEDLIARAFDRKVGVLVDEALGSILKGADRALVPPVRVVTDLVIMPTSRIKCCKIVSEHRMALIQKHAYRVRARGR